MNTLDSYPPGSHPKPSPQKHGHIEERQAERGEKNERRTAQHRLKEHHLLPVTKGQVRKKIYLVQRVPTGTSWASHVRLAMPPSILRMNLDYLIFGHGVHSSCTK